MGHRSSGDGSRKCGKDVQLYLIMISKILDGFSDPIAGQLIDTHRSKRGHCIPVLLKYFKRTGMQWPLLDLCVSISCPAIGSEKPSKILEIMIRYNCTSLPHFLLPSPELRCPKIHPGTFLLN